MALVRQGTRSRPTQDWNLANTPEQSLFNTFDQRFSQLATPFYSQSQWAQGYPVDLYETGEEVVLEMAVPGIQTDDLDISIEGRQLSIRSSLPGPADEERRYWMQTIPYGDLQRTIILPSHVDTEHAQATVRDGLLILRMPKRAEAKSRRIAISNG